MERRAFLKAIGLGAATLALSRRLAAAPAKPNVILAMTDDQGWGDTGYNGHPILKTPTLDAMARSGLRFDRWYSGAPVCSPTRGSCITGRHPYRYGIFFANVGHMRKQEITLAEALKTQGYVTGHFGKWHLGTLTTKIKDSNRGKPGATSHYSPPWDNGFDVCFSTEAKVPTYDPMKRPANDKKRKKKGGAEPASKVSEYGTHYWDGREHMVTDNLEGDDSRIIMDRAVPFIQKAAKARKPFLAVIWFHTPHLPVVAGPKHRKLYADQPEGAQHYLGCITAMDEQMGRLRKELRDLGVAENTMLWFCADNGPEGGRKTPTNGSAGPFRGRKRSLYEGGVRVPGLLEWPAKVTKPRVVTTPCSTCDYFPTVLDALGFQMKGQPEPVDGISLVPLIDGKMTERPRPSGFESSGQVALIGNRYKIYGKGKSPKYQLYDLTKDPGEKHDLADKEPDTVKKMAATLDSWRRSCKDSLAGKDYK